VAAPPAGAIIHGHPDGNRHPYVGMTFNDEFVCSGTLIAPKVFLTAGHCADFLKVPSQGQGWVTFSEDGTSFPEDHMVAAAYTAPGFCLDDGFTAPACPGPGVLGFVRNDVGVAILADSVTMPHYGRLPQANLVSGLPMMTPVTPVGYGIRVRQVHRPGIPAVLHALEPDPVQHAVVEPLLRDHVQLWPGPGGDMFRRLRRA
jgi:hypothetical protein